MLSQVFQVSGEALTALLGSRKPTSRGLCWMIGDRLFRRWREQCLNPTITLAVLMPNWKPDVVWKGSAVRPISGSFYSRPLAAFREYLKTGESLASAGRFKYEKAFGQMLDELDSTYKIRHLIGAQEGLRFRVLTTEASPGSGEFILTGTS